MSKTMEWIRKNYAYVVAALIVTVFFCIPLIGETLYKGHDLTFHINRIVGVSDAIRDGQIIPRLYPYANNGYGYMGSLMYVDFFIYPFAILYMIGVPLVITYKIMIFMYCMLGSVLTLYVSRKIFGDNMKLIILILLLYNLNPYRFINVYIRAAFGEFLGFIFIPLVILALYYIFVEKRDSWRLLGISMALIVLSHSLTPLFISILIAIMSIAFLVVYRKNIGKIKNFLITMTKGTIFALLLSLCFFLPLVEQLNEQRLVISVSNSVFYLKDNLVSLLGLFNPFLSISSQYFDIADISNHALGLFLYIITIVGLLFWKKDKTIFSISCLTCIFLLIASGILPLYLLEEINMIQFSFRWFILIVPLSIIVTSIILDKWNKNIALLVVMYYVIYFLFSSYQLKNSGYATISNNDSQYTIFEENLNYSKDHNEIQISDAPALPLTTKNDYLEDTTFIKLINNGLYEDYIYEYDRYFSKIEFTHESDGGELLMLPLTYYKGYSIYATNDTQMEPIEAVNVDVYHKVGFYTLVGNYHYIVKYEGTYAQKISALISLLSLIFVSSMFFIHKNIVKNNNKQIRRKNEK